MNRPTSRDVFDCWAPRIIVALVFFIPLFFLSALYDAYDLPKLTLVYAADLLLAALWLWQCACRGEMIIRRTSLDIPLLIFFGASLLSALQSLDPALSVFGAYRIYVFGWCPMLSMIALYFFTVQSAPSRWQTSLRWAVLLSAGAVSLYGLLQYFGLEPFSDIPAANGGRVWSSLGNPVYMGALVMMALPLALDPWNPRTVLLLGLSVVGLLLSMSRSAWVATLVASLYSVVLHRKKIREWRVRALAGLCLVAAMIALMPQVRHRGEVLVSRQESSNAARLEGWKAGLRVWGSRPIFGSGPDTFFQAFRPFRTEAYLKAAGPGVTQGDAHNDLIQMAATEGILGLLAYLWIVLVFWRKGLRSVSDSQALWGASLLALFVQNQFNFSSTATSAWAAVFAGVYFQTEARLNRSISVSPSLRFAALAAAGFGLWVTAIPVRADWHYKQGLTWSQAGQYGMALEHQREAVRLNGRIELYETELANVARSMGRFDEAWEAATDLARRHPHNPDVWNNQGVSAMWMVQLARQDKWQDAKDSFEKAVSLDPVFVDAWANLAKWNHLRGNLDEEKRLWKKVLELDPRHEMARQVLGI